MVALYRHFDCNGKLLYIGASGAPLHRLYYHGLSSSWHNQIARIDVEHFETSQESFKAEKAAIRSEMPIYNVDCNESNPLREQPMPKIHEKNQPRTALIRLNKEEIIKYFRKRFSIQWIADFYGTDRHAIRAELGPSYYEDRNL